LTSKEIAKLSELTNHDDGRLTIDEWVRGAAPKTLRTNRIKLAKKNGGELDLLTLDTKSVYSSARTEKSVPDEHS
jgi:hypothetical protein